MRELGQGQFSIYCYLGNMIRIACLNWVRCAELLSWPDRDAKRRKGRKATCPARSIYDYVRRNDCSLMEMKTLEACLRCA
jgi:hypothetical protein